MVMVEDVEGGLVGIIIDGDLCCFMEKEDFLIFVMVVQMMICELLMLLEDIMIIEVEEKM